MDLSSKARSDKRKVAILGPFGTYTHEAAYKVFQDSVQYEECRAISDVFHALSSNIDLGVVPQENTIFGSVVETYDALRTLDSGFVRGDVILKVDHCLLVRSGVKLHEIQIILSHEQALGQCQEFIARHLPGASLEKTPSTAAAARALLEREGNCAAICSRICATLFEGLEVLHDVIQKDSVNFTRFYILARSQNTRLPCQPRSTTHRKALFRTAIGKLDKYSGLQLILNAIRLDITRIDRRPSMGQTPFHDVYFVEVAGSSTSPEQCESMGTSWESEIEQAMDRVRRLGQSIDLIGDW